MNRNMGSEEKMLILKWDKYDENVRQSFTEFQEKGYFSDVTLAFDDKGVKAHKFVLSSCSLFFKRLLLKEHVASNVHPLTFLRGVEAEQLEAVVAFMYQGEVNIIVIIAIKVFIVKVNIKEEELGSFILLVKDLKI